MQIVKMFGPALSGPARLVNRDVPACDEQAYIRAGYQRGSIPEVSAAPLEPQVINTHTEEISLEEPEPPAKPRRKKAQN